ncbi:MAG TPA: hypothetical protein VF158_16740 [Longimicrobiales bacterium]
MTQFYTYRGFSLRRATRPTKVLLTAFLVTAALAVAVGVINYRVRTGLVPSGAATWYLGNEGAVGDDASLLFEKTPLELLDATHPHLFGQAFLFFILCHIFALVPARQRFKMTVYVAAYGSVVVDAAAPWLIRYVSPAFGYLQVAGTAVMTATFLILVLLPLKELWFVREDARERHPAEV